MSYAVKGVEKRASHLRDRLGLPVAPEGIYTSIQSQALPWLSLWESWRQSRLRGQAF